MTDVARDIGAATRLGDRTTIGGLLMRQGFGDWIGYAKMVVGTTAVPLLGLAPGTVTAVLRRIDTGSDAVYISMCAGIAPSASPVTGVTLQSGETITITGRTVMPSTATSVSGPTFARVNDYTFTATLAATDLRTTFVPGRFLRIVETTTGQDTVAAVVDSSWDGSNVTTVTLDRIAVKGTPSAVSYLSGDTTSQPLASVRLVATTTATLIANYYGVQG